MVANGRRDRTGGSKGTPTHHMIGASRRVVGLGDAAVSFGCGTLKVGVQIFNLVAFESSWSSMWHQHASTTRQLAMPTLSPLRLLRLRGLSSAPLMHRLRFPRPWSRHDDCCASHFVFLRLVLLPPCLALVRPHDPLRQRAWWERPHLCKPRRRLAHTRPCVARAGSAGRGSAGWPLPWARAPYTRCHGIGGTR